MAISQQTHIDDLVQKNRTLDHVAKKLKDELLLEQARSREAAKAIKEQWQIESVEWREGCETLQACHRISHLRTHVELERERLAVVKEKDVTRMQIVAKLQRDFRILTFQVRESELERRIEELENTIEDIRAQNEEDVDALVVQYQEAAETLKVRCADLAQEAAQSSRDLAKVQKLRDKIEARFIFIISQGRCSNFCCRRIILGYARNTRSWLLNQRLRHLNLSVQFSNSTARKQKSRSCKDTTTSTNGMK